jgi:hypothetical protein
MLITILAMIKPTAFQSQIRPFRPTSRWKYASRSGSYLVGQGFGHAIQTKSWKMDIHERNHPTSPSA